MHMRISIHVLFETRNPLTYSVRVYQELLQWAIKQSEPLSLRVLEELIARACERGHVSIAQWLRVTYSHALDAVGVPLLVTSVLSSHNLAVNTLDFLERTFGAVQVISIINGYIQNYESVALTGGSSYPSVENWPVDVVSWCMRRAIRFNGKTKHDMFQSAVTSCEFEMLDSFLALEGFEWKSSFSPHRFSDLDSVLEYLKWVHKRALPFDFQNFIDCCESRVDRGMLEWFASIGVHVNHVDSIWNELLSNEPEALEYIIRHYPK